jgi:hypothetical protein
MPLAKDSRKITLQGNLTKISTGAALENSPFSNTLDKIIEKLEMLLEMDRQRDKKLSLGKTANKGSTRVLKLPNKI